MLEVLRFLVITDIYNFTWGEDHKLVAVYKII